MGFPETAKCMACHTTIAKDKPAIQKLTAFAASKQPIPWARVYAVSAGVYWNHRSHLDAGVKCEACHGPVAEMEAMANVTNVTTMAGCVNCHKQSKAGAGCHFATKANRIICLLLQSAPLERSPDFALRVRPGPSCSPPQS